MNSLTAGLAMRSKRPDTPLTFQFPRRSRESQPYTAGTFGHFSMPRTTMSSIARGGSLSPDIRGARDPREDGDVVADQLVESLRAHRARGHPERGEALVRFGVSQYADDLAVELGHDGPRHARGGEQPEPEDGLVARDARFGDGRQAREQRVAARRGHRESHELALAHEVDAVG